MQPGGLRRGLGQRHRCSSRESRDAPDQGVATLSTEDLTSISKVGAAVAGSPWSIEWHPETTVARRLGRAHLFIADHLTEAPRRDREERHRTDAAQDLFQRSHLNRRSSSGRFGRVAMRSAKRDQQSSAAMA